MPSFGGAPQTGCCFEKGRTGSIRLTGDGEKNCLPMPAAWCGLNNETLAAFDEEAPRRLRGGPWKRRDDYADRYMPDIIASFRQIETPMSNSGIDCETVARPGRQAVHATRSILHWSPIARKSGSRRVVRTEPLLWVTSLAHFRSYRKTPLPLAVGLRSLRLASAWFARRSIPSARFLFDSCSTQLVIDGSWPRRWLCRGLPFHCCPESALRPRHGGSLTASDGFPETAVGRKSASSESPACRVP